MQRIIQECGEPGCHSPATLRFRGTGADFFSCEKHKESRAFFLVGNRYAIEEFWQPGTGLR